jgi:hypothetical protein
MRICTVLFLSIFHLWTANVLSLPVAWMTEEGMRYSKLICSSVIYLANSFVQSPLLSSFQLEILSHIQKRKGKIIHHNTWTHKGETYSRMFSPSCWNLNWNIVSYSPHARAVETQKPRGTQLRNSSGALPSRALPPLPSPHFAPHHALLGYAINAGSRNSKEGSRDLRDITCNNTQRCVLPHVRLQRL